MGWKAMAFTGYTISLPASDFLWHLNAYLHKNMSTKQNDRSIDIVMAIKTQKKQMHCLLKQNYDALYCRYQACIKLKIYDELQNMIKQIWRGTFSLG